MAAAHRWQRVDARLAPDAFLEVAIHDATEWAGDVFGIEADTLETLAVVGWQARQMVYVLSDFVERARYQDATWSEIGDALGISRQAARKRFGEGLPPEGLTSLRPHLPQEPH